MPRVQRRDRDRFGRPGGSVGYPADRLHEEVAYIAYHFHWSYTDLMSMAHLERHRWMQEIAKINERLNEAKENDEEYKWQP